MRTVEVFEPALCCSTGVCGVEVDQKLVTFAADVDWLRSHGGDVRRYNLAGEPTVFADNSVVKKFLHVAGSDGLPLVLVEGVTVSTGAYPSREKLVAWAGLEVAVAVPEPAGRPTFDLAAGDGSGDCCGSEGGGSACC